MKKLLAVLYFTVAAFSYAQVPDGFVRIDGGIFMMGSINEPGRHSNEAQRQVTLSPFYMGKFEVTQAEFEEVMGTNPSFFRASNLPVERVSWFDAIEFCNRLSEKKGLTPVYTIDKDQIDPNNRNTGGIRWTVIWDRNANGYRLPTEAEWEFACRAGTTTPFYTGTNITTDQANYDGTRPFNNNASGVHRQRTTPAGSFPPNAFGLYDMHGNVGEWCWDWNASYPRGPETDPKGASFGTYRVFRGGHWNSSGRFLRSAFRSGNIPSSRGDFLGFRLVRNAE